MSRLPNRIPAELSDILPLVHSVRAMISFIISELPA
jgi:hypothetical protein